VLQEAELSIKLIQRTTSEAPSSCGEGEGCASGDAEGHRGGQEEERQDRCQQDRDCLRCDSLPECHVASTEIRDWRRTLRYRNLLVRQTAQMKNRVPGLLMETGVSYNKQRLHKVGYFADLMTTNEEVDESIRPLLLSREMICRSQKLDYALISSLERDPLLGTC
jgi:hypothetical protein